MGPRALETLDSIASDPAQNGRVRASAAKALSDLSGMNLAHENEGGTRKDLAEMTAEDIALAMSKLEALMASKARDIPPVTRQDAPDQQPIEPPTIDQIGRASCRERVCQYV